MEHTAGVKTQDIDPRLFDLYDEYCHGCIDRREFMARAGALAVGGGSAFAMAAALLPQYAIEAIRATVLSPRRIGAFASESVSMVRIDGHGRRA